MVEIKLSRGIINQSATRALQPLRHSILYKKCSANFPANMLFHRKSSASSTCLCLFDWIVIKRTRWWLTHTHKCMSCDIVHKHIFSSIFYTFEIDCIENKFYGENEEMRKPHYFSLSPPPLPPLKVFLSQPKLKKHIKFGFRKRNFTKINACKFTQTKKGLKAEYVSVQHRKRDRTVAKIRHHMQYFFDFFLKVKACEAFRLFKKIDVMVLCARSHMKHVWIANTHTNTLCYIVCFCVSVHTEHIFKVKRVCGSQSYTQARMMNYSKTK